MTSWRLIWPKLSPARIGVHVRAIGTQSRSWRRLKNNCFRLSRVSQIFFHRQTSDRFASLYVDHFRHLKPLLVARGKDGLVRHCHGDLHCGNIVVIDGQPVLFDAIEFSERIATTDVLYDLAFLLMDLLRRDQRRGANFILNRYFDLRRKEETLGAAATLPLFLATRAGVRALVAADRSKELKGEAGAACARGG